MNEDDTRLRGALNFAMKRAEENQNKNIPIDVQERLAYGNSDAKIAAEKKKIERETNAEIKARAKERLGWILGGD